MDQNQGIGHDEDQNRLDAARNGGLFRDPVIIRSGAGWKFIIERESLSLFDDDQEEEPE